MTQTWMKPKPYNLFCRQWITSDKRFRVVVGPHRMSLYQINPTNLIAICEDSDIDALVWADIIISTKFMHNIIPSQTRVEPLGSDW